MLECKNFILCEFIKAEKGTNSRTGEKFYSVKVLYMDRSITFYFDTAELYELFIQLPRMIPITLYVDILVKNDGSIYLRPTSFEQ